METGYSVGQVMVTDVLCTEPERRIIEIAKLMAKRETGSIVVKSNNKVMGILTEQDLARKVLAKGMDAKKVAVSKVMSRPVHTITPEADIYDAILEMGRRKIKHLPVVNNGKLVGIVSFKDIIKLEPDLIDLLSFKSSLTDREKKSIFSGKKG